MATATPHRGATTTPRAGRMDQPGRLQGDNDIVEQYNSPTELALSRAPGQQPSLVHERLVPSAPRLQHQTFRGYTAQGPLRERTRRSLSSYRPPCLRVQKDSKQGKQIRSRLA